jgi:hypothetical protein
LATAPVWSISPTTWVGLPGPTNRRRPARLTSCASPLPSLGPFRPIADGSTRTRITSRSARSSNGSPESLAQELEHRILRPLGLRHTQLATTRTPADLHDQGTNPNLSWAAGGIVSNAPDLVRFFSALLSGRILSRGSLAQMEQTSLWETESTWQTGWASFRLACRADSWGDTQEASSTTRQSSMPAKTEAVLP